MGWCLVWLAGKGFIVQQAVLCLFQFCNPEFADQVGTCLDIDVYTICAVIQQALGNTVALVYAWLDPLWSAAAGCGCFFSFFFEAA